MVPEASVSRHSAPYRYEALGLPGATVQAAQITVVSVPEMLTWYPVSESQNVQSEFFGMVLGERVVQVPLIVVPGVDPPPLVHE